MYEDSKVVINDIKNHLENKFKTGELKIKQVDLESVTISNSDYHFEIQACFIQCRIKSDFSVTIENRIDDTIEDIQIVKGKKYKFTIDEDYKPISKYVVECSDV
ncbi:hypothetical protein [Aeromonas jandaei]|uniref:hypothetical protein n=1 Tax=Aeromonas jandaei TaxID=650 RepID=UPI0011166D08|nr:hypothetical protein [Aeromonas jandaei]TNH92892.1 hypothetical protein CF104_21825 [Aeromonas jandaei]